MTAIEDVGEVLTLLTDLRSDLFQWQRAHNSIPEYAFDELIEIHRRVLKVWYLLEEGI